MRFTIYEFILRQTQNFKLFFQFNKTKKTVPQKNKKNPRTTLAARRLSADG
jgi:hypothetical protein